MFGVDLWFPLVDEKFLVQEMKTTTTSSKLNRLMYRHFTNNDLFQFTQPDYKFGQKVQTEEDYTGYIVGLEFYPETRSWFYGVYLLDRTQELTEEIWYEASQLKFINSESDTFPNQFRQSKINAIELFQFSLPEYKFGQKVQTEDSYIGYIVGLDFYPKTLTWSYGVYLFNREKEFVEEIWYETTQLSEGV